MTVLLLLRSDVTKPAAEKATNKQHTMLFACFSSLFFGEMYSWRVCTLLYNMFL